MSVFHENMLIGASGQVAAGGISRSLRFNSADSAYLSRTPASAGNRKTWTWAGWVKRSTLGAGGYIFSAGTSDTSGDHFLIRFDAADTLLAGRGQAADRRTVQVFRDASAWGHIVVAVDTTQATGSNRIRVYFNGTEITTFQSPTDPSLNQDLGVNATSAHAIGRDTVGSSSYFNGYLADIHFIDGQALTPSSFTEVSATTGQLIPKAYTGSFGTNGFWLKFSDNSGTTSTTLGKDSAGSNNWTPNNFSVASGSGNDSTVDTPTSFGSDTGAGGEVRGNYCTGNPIHPNLDAAPVTLSNGNLDGSITSSSNWYTGQCTLAVTTGKWYFEQTINSGYAAVGIAAVTANFAAASDSVGSVANSVGYIFNGNKQLNGPPSSYGSSIGSGDVIGCAFDMDAQTVTFYKNGASQGVITSAITTGVAYAPCFSLNGQNGTGSYSWNFGQRPFAYTAPSGFKALCDTSLPAPVVAKSSTVMDVKLYTGNGSTQTISGLGFSPDLVWLKCRSDAYSHRLFDQVRGTTKVLYSNLTAVEDTISGVTAFNSDGFTLGSETGGNISGQTFVAWTWDAGTSTVTNTQGSITSSVRANATAGFSIVTYSGTGTTGTVGHGGLVNLDKGMIIVKTRTGASVANWMVGHGALGWTKVLEGLNTTSAATTDSASWDNTAPTSTVFTAGGGQSNVNGSGRTFVAYCFAPVVGYSSFGSYTGNGSTDGPFVYTGFRPRWVMVKSTGSDDRWTIQDTSRSSYNASTDTLAPNLSSAELANAFNLDINSNGFKVRSTNSGHNTSSVTYIYAAFAESPFNYARAR